MAGKQLLIRVGADVADVARKMTQVEAHISKASATAKKMGKAMKAAFAVAATGAVAAFARRMFELGSATEETADKFRVVMGPAIHEATAFVQDFAIKAGLTTQELQELYSQTVILTKGLGMGVHAAADFGEEVIRLAADMASLNNTSTADVLQRINAALAGETDSLRTLTGFISQTEIQKRALADTGKDLATQLTKEEKAVATLAIIQERASDAIGNLDLTQSSAANTAKRVSARFRELRDRVARGLLPAFAQMFGLLDSGGQIWDGLNTMVDYFSEGVTWAIRIVQEFVQYLRYAGAGMTLISDGVAALLDGPGGRTIEDAWDGFLATEASVQRNLLDIRDAHRQSLEALENQDEIIPHIADATGDVAEEAKKAATAFEDQAKEVQKVANELVAGVTRLSRSDNIVALREMKSHAAGMALELERSAEATERMEDMADGVRTEFEQTQATLADIIKQNTEEAQNYVGRLQGMIQSVAADFGGLFGDIGRSIAGLITQSFELVANLDSVGNLASIGVGLNPIGAIGAGAGLLIGGLGKLFGGGPSKEEQEQKRLREEARRLADAFRDVRQSVTEDFELRRLVAQGLDEQADAWRRAKAQQEEYEKLLGFLDLPAGENPFTKTMPPWMREEAEGFLRSGNIAGMEGILTALDVMGAGDSELADHIRELIELLQLQAQEDAAVQREADRQGRLQETADALRGMSWAAREAALAGNELEAQHIQLRASHKEEAAALWELLQAGDITEAQWLEWSAILDGELAAALEAATEASEAAAAAEEELARQREFQAMLDMENLELRLLSLRGMDMEALRLKQKIELLEAIEEGRSAEYIQLLRTIHAEEIRQFNLRESEKVERELARSVQKTTRATKEMTRSMDGAARVMNAPSGYTFQATRNAVLRGTSGNTSVRVEPGAINVYAAPGQDPAAIAQAVVDHIADNMRAGGFNPFTNPGEGF